MRASAYQALEHILVELQPWALHETICRLHLLHMGNLGVVVSASVITSFSGQTPIQKAAVSKIVATGDKLAK